MASFTFLITGCSSGLGAHIALAALAAGHHVIATARNVATAKQAYPSIEKQGGRWLALDVTSPDTETIIAKAAEAHNVNVLINNAGYALRGVLEDLKMSDLRAQFDTNVFGALAVTKGCIPHFRNNRNGTIVNISSTSGISGNAGYTGYAASKFALEGASEALAAELAPFGIRVLIVEPGG
jgi:NAD(P)-dependent dehydrogenase (short-subunit alcohol dehydrogenase family)